MSKLFVFHKNVIKPKVYYQNKLISYEFQVLSTGDVRLSTARSTIEKSFSSEVSLFFMTFDQLFCNLLGKNDRWALIRTWALKRMNNNNIVYNLVILGIVPFMETHPANI